MSGLFCRHNRFTADCPICSKGTVLDSSRAGERSRAKPKSSGSSGGRSGTVARGRGSKATVARVFSGPHVMVGPYEREDDRYDVRLEKVPGGIRLAQWSRGALERTPPELPAADLAELVAKAVEKEILEPRDREKLGSALVEPSTPATAGGTVPAHGASAGRAGDMREELRIERLDDARVRVGRWLFWPARGWELQEAPPMFPAARYAEALRQAAERGVLAAAAPPAP